MSRKPLNPRQEAERLAKIQAKKPDTRVEDDARSASIGLVTPLVGGDLINPATGQPYSHQEPADPLPSTSEIINQLVGRLNQEGGVSVTTTPQQPAVAQKDQTPASGDQTPARRTRKKKESPTVTAWKAQKPFPVDWVITGVMAENPKRRTAADRYAWYKEGMTVQQYMDTAFGHGSPRSLAMNDIRWDYVCGFIKVNPKEGGA